MPECSCRPSADNPSVIGACACPLHGMKALMREVERLQGEWDMLNGLRLDERERVEHLRLALIGLMRDVEDYGSPRRHARALQRADEALETTAEAPAT